MAKVTFNGSERLILVDTGNTDINVQIDLYSDWKEWVATSDNSKYLPAFQVLGGDPISTGVYLGSTYFLENGWRVRPYEGPHQLNIVGNLYTRESGERPVIPTTGSYNILVNMVRSNLVDTIATGGSSVDAAAIANAVWGYMTTGSMASDTFGDHVYRKLLTLAQYMATK
jgi:hypothetical protein